jgi:hypothetical protein
MRMNNKVTKKQSSPDFSSLVGTRGPRVRCEAELPPVAPAVQPYLFFVVQLSGLAFVGPFCALTMAAVKLFSASVHFASNRLCGSLARGRK